MGCLQLLLKCLSGDVIHFPKTPPGRISVSFEQKYPEFHPWGQGCLERHGIVAGLMKQWSLSSVVKEEAGFIIV